MRNVEVDVDHGQTFPHVRKLNLGLVTPDPYVHEPQRPLDVMADVGVLMAVPGISWNDLGKLLIPLAFRLLCMAAFKKC